MMSENQVEQRDTSLFEKTFVVKNLGEQDWL